MTYTTARNNTYSYDYDGNGRAVKVTDPLEGVVERTFDNRGNQTGLKDQNNNQTAYSYDLLNRLVSETTADGFSDSYAYDSLGELTSYTNKRGQTVTYTYDADGRRISRATPEGTAAYTYDNNSNLLTVTDEKGTIGRAYDSLNRVISYTNAQNQTIGYEYDSNSNLTKLTYPDGKAVTYAYNANNQMISVTDWNGRITTYAYDNNGRLISETRPNGTVQTYEYNANGQLISTTDKKADGSIINKYDYEYDPDGNIITEDSINEPNYNNITIPSSEMNYGSANRLTDFNGTAISYDNDGNMLNTPLKNDKWGELTYNSKNMLTDIVTSEGAISFEYDAENNRTLKNEYGKTTSYVINPNAELSQVLMSTTGNETTYYIYGLGLIAKETQDSYKTYHYDYRGSTTAITDTNGNVTDRVYYDPYGSILTRTGETETPFLYVGKYGVETDDNGLYYMRARYYNPQIQRFVNVDPIRDGYNWYSYVIDNPIIYIDIYGKSKNVIDEILREMFDFSSVRIDELSYDDFAIYLEHKIKDSPIVNAMTQEHFEKRDRLNNVNYSYDEMSKLVNGPKQNPDKWRKLSPQESACHNNGVGKPEEKYIDNKGHEIVYDGDTHKIVVDSKYKGTYNYGVISKNDPISYIKHTIDDLLPYIIWGNSRDEDTHIIQRIYTSISNLF